MSQSQNNLVLSHLKAGHTITPMEALAKFGCMRLAARIKDLRQSGHHIATTMELDERTGKRWARYSWIKEAESEKA